MHEFTDEEGFEEYSDDSHSETQARQGFTDEELRQFEEYRQRLKAFQSHLHEPLGASSPLTEDVWSELPFMAKDVKERFKGIPDSLLLFLALMTIHTELENIRVALVALNVKFEAGPSHAGYYDRKDPLLGVII